LFPEGTTEDYIGEIYSGLEDGSVEDLIGLGELSLDDSALLLKHSLIGLNYLHSRQYVHQDIKPQNILYRRDKDGGLTFKIADFGLCCRRNPGKLPDAGTPRFMAPEALGLTEHEITEKSDIWSLFVTMLWVMEDEYRSHWSTRMKSHEKYEVDENDSLLTIIASVQAHEDDPVFVRLRDMASFEPDERPTTTTLLWELFKVIALATAKPTLRRGIDAVAPIEAISSEAEQPDIFDEPPASFHNGRTDTTFASSLPHPPEPHVKGKKRVFQNRDSARLDSGSAQDLTKPDTKGKKRVFQDRASARLDSGSAQDLTKPDTKGKKPVSFEFDHLSCELD